MIGESVGPYRILERLGAGGMGEVYLAEDARLRRQVALKRLTSDTMGNTEARARILREARAAARVHHPGIATIFDVVEHGDEVWIVMEYVQGETLAARLLRGRPPLFEALDIGEQVAGALAAAHAGGILHCDLKPSNVHLTPDGKAKILDFGLAQRPEAVVAEAETQIASIDVSGMDSGRRTGTAGYMAPERLSTGRPDERSDIYSLGVLLFELLTGRRPFFGSDLIAVAARALTTPAPSVQTLEPAIPAPISDVVARAVVADPDLRFQTATDFVQALRAAREGTSASVTQSASQSPPQSQSQSESQAWMPVQAPVPAASSGAGRPVRLALVTIGALAVLGAGMMLGGWWTDGGEMATATPEVPAIVVKPFANLSGDAANDYLGVGMADNLTTRLAALPYVTVMSRAATADYLASHPGSTTLVRDLGASYVVDGGVSRSGDRLSVTVTLLQPDGSVAWANDYDGDLPGLFDMQRKIALGVADGLNLVLSEGDQARLAAKPTESVEAFADYAQANLFLDRWDVPGNLDRAIDLFGMALKKDPGFALAQAGLGAAYWQMFVNTKDASWTARATDASLEALRLDPRQAQVHVVLATIYNGLGRPTAAVEALREALALQPNNDDAHRLLGNILADEGRIDDAVVAYRRAIAIRPNYWQNHNRLAVALMLAGRFADAQASAVRVTELQPDSAVGFNNLGVVAMMQGDLPLAQQSFERGVAISPRYSILSNLGTIYYWKGQFDEARQAYEAAIKEQPDNMLPHRNLGDSLTQLGRTSEAEAAYRHALDLAGGQLRVNPRDATTLAVMAVLETKLKRPADARQHIDEALALAPTSGDIHFYRAVVAALTGERDVALAALKDAMSFGYPAEFVARELDLQSLRGTAEYRALLAPR